MALCDGRGMGHVAAPAMKPTIGFLTPRALALVPSGTRPASSSAEPDMISPNHETIEDSVLSRAARKQLESYVDELGGPFTGSLARCRPAVVLGPGPSFEVWNTAS